MKSGRKSLIYYLIELFKSVTNYISYRFTGHVIKWNDEQDYPYNTEFGIGRTKEEMERIDNENSEEPDEEELLGI